MNANRNISSHSENENWDDINKILDQMEEVNQFNADKAWQNLHHRLETDNLIPEQNRGSRFRFLYPYAAAAILVLLLAGVWFFKPFTARNPETELVASLNPEVPFVLPDGSKIYLYKGASASFVANDFNSNRNLALNGEAFFEIAPDANHPFTIKAGNANIKVVGTSFLVLPNGAQTTVIVNTGKVQLSAVGNQTESILLESGFEGIHENGKLVKKPNANPNFMSWVNHLIVFKATSLQQVVETINKTYTCNIELADPKMSELELTATYNGFTVENIVESLSLTLNLKAQYTDKSIILDLR